MMRRELDRLTGELMRRQEETDACLILYARREALRRLYNAPGRARMRDLYRWARS